MNTSDIYIQHDDDLDQLVRKALKTDAIGLDTEFVWERTYYPQLGLIQLALSDEECYLIDPLRLTDLSRLGDLLSDRSVVKIFHDAPQDLQILHRATGATPQNIFDTRLAAGFCNMPATLSLSNLTKELLDIELPKEETRTNWLQRPLMDEQMRYGLDDVRYLRAIRVLLLSRIIGPRIRSWLQEELNLLNNPANYSMPPDNERFLKFRGTAHLNGQELAILRNLTSWREGMARKLDRPRGHVIKDATLIELSHKKPKEAKQLKECGMSDKGVRKYGENVLAIIATTLRQPEKNYPEPQKILRLNKSDKQSYEKLQNLIELKSNLLGIAPSLIGNSSELKLLVKTFGNSRQLPTNPPELRQTNGWRKCFLEDFFRRDRKQ